MTDLIFKIILWGCFFAALGLMIHGSILYDQERKDEWTKL